MGLYVVLALRDAANNSRLGPQHVLLVLLTLVQAGIYWYSFVRSDRWPPARHRLVLNFVVAPALIYIQQAIEPAMANMFWLYFGHVFSQALPLWAGIAVLCVMSISFFVITFGLNGLLQTPGALIAALLAATFASVFYFFMHKTSEFGERRKALLVQLQAAYRELDAARAKESELAALQERERIARDMHDNLGHVLVALSVQLEATQRLYKKDPERAAAQMEQMKALTRESMDALRRSLAGLRAPGLGERLLRQALQEACTALSQRSGMNIACHIAPAIDALSPTVSEALWGVSQEALTNIEKHAGARHAEVRMDVSANHVALCVSDDGIGLPEDAQDRAGHFGLHGMKERIEGVGGTLTLLTQPAGGTRIEARIPLM
jgi:signal transduction histidine kinase